MTVLPYPEMPPIVCYHYKAFPLGVIQANSPKDITKWMCAKCMNCAFHPDSPQNKFDLNVYDIWGNTEGITTEQTFRMRKDMLPRINIDLLPMFKILIDNGCYIQGIYNEKHIPSKWAYNREDYVHDFLIIGYDDVSFYSVGYVADGRFKRFEIPIQNFLNGIQDMDNPNVVLNFYSYNEGAVPEPNTEVLLSNFRKYNSVPDGCGINATDKVSNGIAAIACLKEFFVNEVKNEGKIYIDRRYARVLYEQKWLLSQLVRNFLDSNESQMFMKHVDGIFDKAKCIHMLGMKMAFTGDAKIIHRVESLMDEIIEEELGYIPELLKVLEDKYS